MLMEQVEQSIDTMCALKALGARPSIDDFGTGYSSLAYLKRFPIDKLKIDQSFVRGIGLERSDGEIITTIIAMARALGLQVLAEGVETAEQQAFAAAWLPVLSGLSVLPAAASGGAGSLAGGADMTTPRGPGWAARRAGKTKPKLTSRRRRARWRSRRVAHARGLFKAHAVEHVAQIAEHARAAANQRDRVPVPAAAGRCRRKLAIGDQVGQTALIAERLAGDGPGSKSVSHARCRQKYSLFGSSLVM